ncbi:MAG: hypothetical protein DMG06_18735 [Acidobacteria bacterium]|nr:MAG: hypothetical protein DMG06_18735 [Acidobacteriota bacterium]
MGKDHRPELSPTGLQRVGVETGRRWLPGAGHRSGGVRAVVQGREPVAGRPFEHCVGDRPPVGNGALVGIFPDLGLEVSGKTLLEGVDGLQVLRLQRRE